MKLDTHSTYRGFKRIILENQYIRLDVLPELGANIYNLIYKPADRNLLWHNANIAPRKTSIGTSYGDNFYGGWDELFPNDSPERFEGVLYPDHGELWCQQWEYEIVEDNDQQSTVHLQLYGSITKTLIEKWITLKAGENRVHFRHRLTNLGQTLLKFLWKPHPALALSPHHRIDLPARSAEVGPSLGKARAAKGHTYDWPFLKTERGGYDIRFVPPAESQITEMHYATELKEGWCALTDTRSRIGFGLAFDKEVFSTVWIFLSCGGWRGHYLAVLEPSTAYPHGLAAAQSRGQISQLAGQTTLETNMVAVIYDGIDRVGGIDLQGQVRSQSR